MTGQVPPSRCSPSVPSCSQRAQHYLPQPFQKPPEAPVEAFLPGVPDDKQYMDQCCSFLAPPRRICTTSAANRQPTRTSCSHRDEADWGSAADRGGGS